MAKRTDWQKLRDRRMADPKAKRGHEDAALSYALAEQVRQIREDKGLSQAELAEGMGTTQSAVARLEAGGTSPTIPTLRKLADALSVELILGFHDPRKAPKARSRGVGAAKTRVVKKTATMKKGGKTAASSTATRRSAGAKGAGRKR